jgi:tRNA threonylcarbamoyladenosine biosynthesis protein TsaB
MSISARERLHPFLLHDVPRRIGIVASVFALSLETSGRLGSVALFRDGALLEERTYPHGLQHAAAIVPMLNVLCRDYQLTPKQIEQIYISVGPGSFTGLRVGITLAKTLAYSTAAKIVAVPSADVLIENLPADATNGIIVLDAKRGQIFTARYRRDETGNWINVEPAHLDTLAKMIERSPRPVHLIGEGVPYHRESVPQSDQVIVADESLWLPSAAVVGKLGHLRALRGEFTDPFRLLPTYVRLAEAEEKRLIAEGKLNADGTPKT